MASMRSKILERRDLYGVYFVLLIGISARLLRLGYHGLFFDEAWSWAVSLLSPAQIYQLSLGDPHPPLYYLLLKVTLLVLPSTKAVLRMQSVLCSVAALAITLVFVARWWDLRAALYAGWFTALSSFDLYYAQDARMYTLLGLLGLLAYVLLIESARGRSYLLVGWGFVCVLMAWTHFYGFLVVIVCVAFVLGLYGAYRARGRPSPFDTRWLTWALVLMCIGILPIFTLLWGHRASGAGGAWLPRLRDLLGLFTLWSVGLTAVRDRFLDSAHLVLPIFAELPLWVWGLLGAFVSGQFALWGIWTGWKAKGARRWASALALLLMSMPVAIAYGYAVVFGLRTWAYKPFLGAGYLFYMWAGVGLSRVPYRHLRRGIFLAVLGLSLVSLIPYYTAWRKTNDQIVLRSVPLSSERGMVLLERGYNAPVAYYYLGSSAQVWSLGGNQEDGYNLVRVSPNGVRLQDFHFTDCDDPTLQQVTDVWMYGAAEWIVQGYDHWPRCLTRKSLWVFEGEKWIRFGR